ncbi:MAG: trypsin-like peptidase domain-containing protein [Candidatus Eisenbacteria bacterium]|nr:trypsin-like peptidase domain-containing protein [Candidatus Eisenbacteria bacterium]
MWFSPKTKVVAGVSSGARVVAILLTLGALAAGLFLRFREAPVATPPEPPPATDDLPGRVEEIARSVVLVWYQTAGGWANCGTAFAVDGEGRLLTCSHLVHGRETVTVTMPAPEGERNVRARVIAEDPNVDAALLLMEEAPPPPVRLGRSDGVRVGEEVGFVGYPLGYTVNAHVTPTLTMGHVAAKPNWRVRADSPRIPMIQVDASIAVGNSGSPLFRAGTGEVVGMMKSQLRVPGQILEREDLLGWVETIPEELAPHAGIGLALPIDQLKDFLERNGVHR